MTVTDTTAESTVSPTPQQLDPTVAAYIQQHPEFAWIASDPELGPLLTQSITQNWDATKWQEALQGTTWYKTHSAAARDWAELVGSDPAEADARVQAEKQDLQATTRTLGVNLTDPQLISLAYQALEYGWTTQETQNHVQKMITYSNGKFELTPFYIDPATGQAVDSFTGRQAFYGPNGEPATPDQQLAEKDWGPGGYQAGTFNGGTVYYKTGTGNAGPGSALPGGGALQNTLDQLKAEAGKYLVPISDTTLAMWSQQIAAGQTDLGGFDAYLKEQAKSLFPTMSNAIDMGITPAQYVDPYKQVAGRVLGVDPNTIDMNNPLYSRAVTQKDPKTGLPTAMSLYDWEKTVMSDPAYGYKNSQNAVDRAAALAQGLGQMFGTSPGGGTGFAGAAPVTVA